MAARSFAHIPIYKSVLPELNRITPYLEIAYQNGKFSNFGEISHRVESSIAKLLNMGPDQIVTCSNATLALCGALATSGNDLNVWNLPSWTFTATASAVMSSNNRGNFLDVDENWRVHVEKKATIGNLIDVLPFGDGPDFQRLSEHKIQHLVVDGAASFFALTKTDWASVKMRFGLVVSFHPTKVPAGAEGAVFISNDAEWLERFRLWTIFGMGDDRISKFPGTNAKLSEFSASVILASLDSFHSDIAEWRLLSEIALGISQEFKLIVTPAMAKGLISPYWIVRTEKEKISRIAQVFNQENIAFRKWWGDGCHRMNAYKTFSAAELTNTNKIASETLGLPFYRGMTDMEWERISKALHVALEG